MLYEFHIAPDLRVDNILLNHNKIVDKNVGLFREWSLKTPPMLNYTSFVIMPSTVVKFRFCLVTQKHYKYIFLQYHNVLQHVSKIFSMLLKLQTFCTLYDITQHVNVLSKTCVC